MKTTSAKRLYFHPPTWEALLSLARSDDLTPSALVEKLIREERAYRAAIARGRKYSEMARKKLEEIQRPLEEEEEDLQL